MVARIINWMLVGIIIVVAMLLVRARYEFMHLKTEADALEARVGGAQIADPNNYFIRLLSFDNHHITWRVYMPATNQMATKLGMQEGLFSRVTSKNVLKQSSVVRWRVKEVDGHLVQHVSSPFHTGTGTINKEERFLLENISECEVSVAGQGGGEYFHGDEVVTLLTIKATPDLLERACTFMHENQVKGLLKPFVFKFGLPASMEALKSKTHE